MLPSGSEGSPKPKPSLFWSQGSMKQCVLVLVVVCGVCAGVAQNAHAQMGTWADRGYVNIGFGVESGSSSISDTQNLTIYDEAGHITSSTTWTSGAMLDGGFGVRAWRNLTGGCSYHQEEHDKDRHLIGSIPSPISCNSPSTLDQDLV